MDEFRAEVREFIAANLPDDVRDACMAGQYPTQEMLARWQRILADQGWSAPNWPVEYGGPDWSTRQVVAFADECESNFCPPLPNFGIGMIGPLLMTYGNQAQKDFFLEKTRTGEFQWCQGYSEPGAGSDLALLKTRAVLEDGHYVGNGAKIWTSEAHHADWMFCLVRTDPEAAKKQDGISMLLIDMTTPGITIRPIIGLNGIHYFNEIFFDDARVKAENLIGEQDNGWQYAKALLSDERFNQARTAICRGLLARLKRLAAATMCEGNPLIQQDYFRRKIGRAEVRIMALEAVKQGFVDANERGGRLGPEVSILKLTGSELLKDLDRLLMEAAGVAGLPYDPGWMQGRENARTDDIDAVGTLSGFRHRRKAATIAGGSSEVQRMIIAKRVLEL